MPDVTIKLESIRDDQRDKYWHYLHGSVRMGKSEVKGSRWLMGEKPFVKLITGVNHAGVPTKREIEGRKSYTEARGSGARGVFYWYTLQEGECYQIRQQVSRTKSETVFAVVHNGALVEATQDQVARYVVARLSNA